MWLAFKRVSPTVFCGIVPLLILFVAARAAIHINSVGVDFRGELYPEAKLILAGKDPFPPPYSDLSSGVNRIFPVFAALLVIPLTVFSAKLAAGLFVVVLLVALVATIRILGVTDWRIYGIVAVWPASISALQTGNLTIVLGLLVALGWRYRNQALLCGIALGAAIGLKIFLWPLLVWLLATRRYRATATTAAVAIGSTLLVLPFATFTAYTRLLDNLGNTFSRESYNLIGLLVQTGIAGLGTAKVVADCVGIVVLGLAYRRRSLTLGIAASLVLSPIVWLHYFELLLLPLGINRPRLSPVWLLPFVLFICPGTGANVKGWTIIVALIVFAAVTVTVEWGLDPPARRAGRPAVRD
jgi:alpha-1,2-mannosyltransferase